MDRKLSPWALVPALFALARAAQLLLHWLLPTPYGVRLASTNPGELPRAALLAGVSLLLVVVLFRLVAHALGRLLGPRGERAALVLYAAFVSLELVYAQVDLELMRWLGQHVDLGWFGAYGWKPDALKRRLFRSDALATSLAFALAFLPPVAFLAALRRRPAAPLRRLTTGFLAIPMLLGLRLAQPFFESRAELSPVQPPLVTFGEELLRRSGAGMPEEELARGVAALHGLIGRPASDFPVAGYPLWRPVPDEEARLARFRARSADEKRDLVLVLLESPQGWEFDLRRPEARRTFPSLAALFEERGVLFPRCQAVGFPSPEGRIGVHLGLWSHPTERILERFLAVRSLSLPQVLARAGYQTALVTAGDPSFDRMQPWYDRWYETWEYDPERTDDLSAAERVVQALHERSSGKPRFLLFNTVTMHAPLTFPGSSTDPKQPFHEKYMAAARYADAALGRLFDGLRESGRWQSTIVVVVGDHSWPGPWIGLQAPRAGTPNAGETWVPLLIAAPGSAGGRMRGETVSQIDVPPTVLGLLGVEASTSFAGRDLLRPGEPVPEGALSFRNGGLAFTRGEVRLQLELREGGFLKKTRTYDWDPNCPDPEPYGCYRNGTVLPLAPEDPMLLAKIRLASRAYGELWASDRLVPPAGMIPYRQRERPQGRGGR
jgi:lipoteichoic acid synthase